MEFYLPINILFVEQRSTANYFTPYKFSAKEKDEETSNNPTSASPKRGGTTEQQLIDICHFIYFYFFVKCI